jgi:ATP-dependent Clp protease ATP-binding subunit ClpX
VNTKNILFILGGAFDGIDKIIAARINKNKMGFARDVKDNNEEDDLLKFIQPEDLLKYGLIPELIGRIPIVAPLHQLNEEAMRSILTDPKNAILKQYKKLFLMEGVELEFDKFALNAIVEKAMIKKTGARALRSIVEDFMLDIMYELPNRKSIEKCIITKDVVEKGEEPLFIKAEKKSA